MVKLSAAVKLKRLMVSQKFTVIIEKRNRSFGMCTINQQAVIGLGNINGKTRGGFAKKSSKPE